MTYRCCGAAEVYSNFPGNTSIFLVIFVLSLSLLFEGELLVYKTIFNELCRRFKVSGDAP